MCASGWLLSYLCQDGLGILLRVSGRGLAPSGAVSERVRWCGIVTEIVSRATIEYAANCGMVRLTVFVSRIERYLELMPGACGHGWVG